MWEVNLQRREAFWQTHLSKTAFADDFEVVKITRFDPDLEKKK